jgi:hypothetical protein
MPKKVELDLVKIVLQRNELDVRKVATIIEEINQETAAQVDPDKEPAVKKQFVIVVADNTGIMTGYDFTGWVLQIEESESVSTLHEKVSKAVTHYNSTKKGRRLPVRTLAEVCEFIPAKILKEYGLFVKTKEPVYVVPAKNKLSYS